MKTIQFNTDEVISSFSVLSSIVGTKVTFPILENLCIKTKPNNVLSVTTSDTETWLTMNIACISADEDTDICINAKSFVKALRNLNGKLVTMEIDEASHSVTCKYDTGEFTIPYEDCLQYPMPQYSKDAITHQIAISSTRFANAIKRTLFASSYDEFRLFMNGIHFDFFKDKLVAVATDGRKLAKYEDFSIKTQQEETIGITVNSKACSTITDIISLQEEYELSVEISNSTITLSCPLFILTSRLVETRYPKYENVIPRNNTNVVLINREMLVSSIKRVLPMGNTNLPLCALRITKNYLTITSEDTDFRKSATENIACEYEKEKDIEIGFHGVLLLQVLQAIPSEKIKISLSDSASVAGVFEEESYNGEYFYTSILMPTLIQ